ncbi:MAG: GGDEF domain-containing protein [Treponema sp.]|nr:GGDEF domain-containing protein [Treponema sp.]
MCKNLLSFLSKKKTLLFLIMCLAVHACNAVLFYVLGILPLAGLNVGSTLFYVAVLLLIKKNTDLYIVFTYLEIVVFSFVSELFTGGALSYIFYVIGMISVVFYLLPRKFRFKHLFQCVGIIFAIAIFIVHIKKNCLFPQYGAAVERCKNQIGLLNLLITLFTLFYVSNLYFFELNVTHEKLAYTSNHDLLTGLFNRRFFEHIMRRNKSEIENKFTIAIFDIDDFKKINDTYGHQAGDAVLKMVSGILENGPERDYVPVRWGGEEFILYMPQTDEDKAHEYLESLCEKVRNLVVECKTQHIKVTITIGMCTGTSLTEYEDVIRVADARLYTGKRSGKNCVVWK